MIQIQYNLERDDFKCLICYETVTTPFLQCQYSHHFVCFNCCSKSKRNCPVCITSKLYHNKLMEKSIKDQMVPCPSEECPAMMFNWSIDELLHNCKYKKYKCDYCDDLISMESLDDHLINDCSVEWISSNLIHTNGSIELESYYIQKVDGYQFDLIDIKYSFVVMFFNYTLLFTRQDLTGWIVRVLNNFLKETNSIEITYSLPSLPSTNNNYHTSTVVTIQPEQSLENTVSLPEIPIETMLLEFKICNELNVADRFFAGYDE